MATNSDVPIDLRMPDGTWTEVGISAEPINVYNASNSWQSLGGGGGNLLKLRMPNGTWQAVASSGVASSGGVFGTVLNGDDEPLAGRVVTVDGAAATTSAADGTYQINGLTKGTHTVRCVSDDIPIQATFTTNDVHLRQRIDFTFSDVYVPFPISMTTFPIALGWFANVFAAATTTLPHSEKTTAATISTLSAESVAAVGHNYDNGYIYTEYLQEQVGWMTVPIGALRDYALSWQYSKGQIYPNIRLSRIDVVASMQGYSVNKTTGPWASDYFDAGTTLGLSNGIGVWRYQGTTDSDVTESVSWQPDPAYLKRIDVPVITDRPFARESDGEDVFRGDLNQLGVLGAHGLYRPITTARHSLDPDTTDTVQYHGLVSTATDIPALSAMNENDTRASHNLLYIELDVEFLFGHD